MSNPLIWLRRLLFVTSLLVITSQNIAFSDVASLDSDYVPGQADVTTKLNNDRHTLTNSVNNVRGVFAGGIQSSGQIKADTVGEENMADDANPRIRTGEGASCPDLVVSGFLPATSSTLVLSIPPGIAYPDGYRIEKTTTTAANLTASKWTFYYLLTSGSFATNVVTIGAATPSSPANSALLFRASTDSTTINTITDLRKTSCAAGPFSAIADASNEATLANMFSNGAWVRRFSPAGRTPNGFAQGLFVSYNTATTFKVTPGSAYINGKYRTTSVDVTVPQTLDDPTQGVSGLDTGAIAASTQYFVYAVADQDALNSMTISFSTNPSSPLGTTNSRLLGSIKTDATSLFTSRDTVTAHALSDREIVGGWVAYTTVGSTQIRDSYNVSALTDDATGVTTISWDADFNNASYDVSGIAGPTRGYAHIGSDPKAGTVQIVTTDNNGASSIDNAFINVTAFGDMRR